LSLITHAQSALETLLANHGDGYAFPSDAIWQHFSAVPESTRRPGLIKSFEKAGLIVATGRMTKAITGSRKGSPTKEYTFGAKVSPSSLGLAQGKSPLNEGIATSEAQIEEAVPLASAEGIFPLPHPLQRIVHGCPGSGKSYNLSEDANSAHFVIRTVFHPETTYSDFVGGLRPQSIYREVDPKPVFIGATEEIPGEPVVQYILQPGPLLKAYQLACLNPNLSIVEIRYNCWTEFRAIKQKRVLASMILNLVQTLNLGYYTTKFGMIA
jgi:5-methylcytosine-specific restriction enzyme B